MLLCAFRVFCDFFKFSVVAIDTNVISTGTAALWQRLRLFVLTTNLTSEEAKRVSVGKILLNFVAFWTFLNEIAIFLNEVFLDNNRFFNFVSGQSFRFRLAFYFYLM